MSNGLILKWQLVQTIVAGMSMPRLPDFEGPSMLAKTAKAHGY